MELARAGADRQAMHEVIRQHALDAWQAVQKGEGNPLADRLASDPEILRYLPEERVRALMEAGDYVGNAPERARRMAAMIREFV
jgi:adenylosuccinate lyase